GHPDLAQLAGPLDGSATGLSAAQQLRGVQGGEGGIAADQIAQRLALAGERLGDGRAGQLLQQIQGTGGGRGSLGLEPSGPGAAGLGAVSGVEGGAPLLRLGGGGSWPRRRAATRAANSSSADSRSGARASTRPLSRACPAVSWRSRAGSSRIIRTAFSGPTTDCSRVVPPQPGRIPRLVSGTARPRTSGAAVRTSAISATSRPPPRATPLRWARIGTGLLSTRICRSWAARVMGPTFWAAVGSVNMDRSAPARNTLPVPVIAMAPISPASARSRASLMAPVTTSMDCGP